MLYNENIYLAEDRILCMGIHKKGFDMAFLPDAYAEVADILHEDIFYSEKHKKIFKGIVTLLEKGLG